MNELSRRCIPWTPLLKPVGECRVGLVSSAGVRMATDLLFDCDGDTSYRIIEASASGADLSYDDEHYDHACVDQDINCVFPVDRLRELEGRPALCIHKAVSPETPWAGRLPTSSTAFFSMPSRSWQRRPSQGGASLARTSVAELAPPMNSRR